MSLISKLRNAKTKWQIKGEDGKSLLSIKSIQSITVTHGGSVVSEPIEEGSFTSYNKTTEPLAITMEVSLQGADKNLQYSLKKLDELREGVTKFSIITPYREYTNMCLESFDYDMRAENGLGVLFVTMNMVEIREVAAAYSEVSADTIQKAQAASNAEAISEGQAASASDVSSIDTGTVSGVGINEEEAAAVESATNSSTLNEIAKGVGLK